jgi:hypothetical protein
VIAQVWAEQAEADAMSEEFRVVREAAAAQAASRRAVEEQVMLPCHGCVCAVAA